MFHRRWLKIALPIFIEIPKHLSKFDLFYISFFVYFLTVCTSVHICMFGDIYLFWIYALCILEYLVWLFLGKYYKGMYKDMYICVFFASTAISSETYLS